VKFSRSRLHLDTNHNSYRTVLIVGDKHEIFGFEIPMSDVHAVDTAKAGKATIEDGRGR
jgi:hypothetical protein